MEPTTSSPEQQKTTETCVICGKPRKHVNHGYGDSVEVNRHIYRPALKEAGGGQVTMVRNAELERICNRLLKDQDALPTRIETDYLLSALAATQGDLISREAAQEKKQ